VFLDKNKLFDPNPRMDFYNDVPVSIRKKPETAQKVGALATNDNQISLI